MTYFAVAKFRCEASGIVFCFLCAKSLWVFGLYSSINNTKTQTHETDITLTQGSSVQNLV